MEAIFYVIAKVISLLLSAVSLAMSTRIIMEIIALITSRDVSGNRFYVFIYTVTEIFVTPFRYLCAKLNLFQGTPIDAPFYIAYFALIFINGLLPII